MTVTETKRQRGPTKAADRARAQVVEDTANQLVGRMAAALDGRDAEFVISVIRAVVRAVARWLVIRAGAQRCVGIFQGALAGAIPGWAAETTDARAAADALFEPKEAA